MLRSCVGSELFVSDADTRNRGKISLLEGSYLSLNLCLQLKNMPPSFQVQLTKLYCILYSSQKPASDGQNTEQMPSSALAWEGGDMIEMNDRLFRFVTERFRKTNTGKRSREDDINKDGKVVTTFVEFKLNSKGQGFSKCLLDVSKFLVGTYSIKWLACYVDSQGSYWSLLPFNAEVAFTIRG